jgi:transposase InsO family protein
LKKPPYRFTGRGAIQGFGKWAFDLLGPLPRAQDKCYILSGIEMLSGFPVGYPLSDATANAVVKAMRDHFSLYSTPRSLITDNGPCFQAASFKKFCRGYDVDIEYVPSYQPEWNGKVERLNGLIRHALTKTHYGNWNTWPDSLPAILAALRAKKGSNGVSPYYLMFGIKPGSPRNANDQDFAIQCAGLRHIGLQHLAAKRWEQLRPALHANAPIQFATGDKVLLLDPRIRESVPRPKTEPRYLGPFVVNQALDHNLYRLVGRREPIHISRLRPFMTRDSLAPVGECQGVYERQATPKDPRHTDQEEAGQSRRDSLSEH